MKDDWIIKNINEKGMHKAERENV